MLLRDDATDPTRGEIDEAGNAAEDLDELDCGQSFTPATLVLLAGGKTVPIADLRPGDKVLATNVRTGTTQPETVTAVLVNHDHDLYDLTIRSGNKTAVIHTTSNHLFWDPYLHQGVPANKLAKDEHLATANGAVATVVGGSVPADRDGWMWDLTAPGNNDHDFYVVTDILQSSFIILPVRQDSITRLPRRVERGPTRTALRGRDLSIRSIWGAVSCPLSAARDSTALARTCLTGS